MKLAPVPLLPSYQRLLEHCQGCPSCRRGHLCKTGRTLTNAWREQRRNHKPVQE